jgi:hypothetical protein
MEEAVDVTWTCVRQVDTPYGILLVDKGIASSGEFHGYRVCAPTDGTKGPYRTISFSKNRDVAYKQAKDRLKAEDHVPGLVQKELYLFG